MPRFSSNDMVHNHYLEEAKNKTQASSRNSEPSVMPFARSQSTANGSKPKPRINDQNSRNWPASKSSCITTKTVPIAEHSRNSSNFSDSKHVVCSTCQKCVFNANHDSCVTKFLKEVYSRVKVPSNKTSNKSKHVEQKSIAKKPERHIPKGHRFSIKKTFVVHEETMTPRSCLSLLNAACKKALHLLKKGLQIRGEAVEASKRRRSLLDHKIQLLSKGSSEGSGIIPESMVDVPIHQEDPTVQKTPLIDTIISMVTDTTSSTPTPPTTQAHDQILGFNSLVHSFRALSTLRRSGLRTASAAAKPCQGDSSEFYSITVGFNSLVHSFRALSTLRRSSLRTASAAAKPCQGDSSEFYSITNNIYTDKQGTVVLATLFNKSEQNTFVCLLLTYTYRNPDEDDWDAILEGMDFGDIPEIDGLDLPPYVCNMGKNSRIKKKSYKNYKMKEGSLGKNNGELELEEVEANEEMVREYKAIKEKDDRGAFVLTIRLEGRFNTHALADTGSNINIIPYRIFKKLGREHVKPVRHNMSMLNHYEAEPIGMLKDVLCQVSVTTVLARFLILDMPVDRTVLIIIGRSFLHTCGGIINTLKGTTLTFDGVCHQNFYVVKIKNDGKESDSDDEKEYYLKKDEIGRPFCGPNLMSYFDHNDPMERALAI
nr:hypothetical protein [Tanacetum cinerariifolium]